jgi:hypothetical protein
VRAIQASPLRAGRLAQLEDHGERGHAAEATRSPTPDIAAITDQRVQSYPHARNVIGTSIFSPISLSVLTVTPVHAKVIDLAQAP